ncbi:MAG: hypothetical protein ABI905_06520 [Betaproteobacteria bacterium]
MQPIGHQSATHDNRSHRNAAAHGDSHKDQDGEPEPPLSGPHDYETRVQSYLQSLKAYIESANVRKKWVPGEDKDRRAADE